MHLDDTTIDRYLTRSLDPQQQRTYDRHVETCLQCLLLVESTGLAEARWERRGVLGRLVRVTPPVVQARPAVLRRAA
jgi:hypothetical protein